MINSKELFLPVLIDGKYGFINKDKDIVIKPKFKYSSNRFKDGYCVVTYIKKIQKESRWVFGYIDKNGHTNIYLHLDSASEFNEGMAKIKINGKYGYIDQSLDIVINPEFEYANNFSEGLASIRINKEWGFINKYGNIVIKPNYTYAGSFFEEVSLVESKNKYGYIDKKR